MKKISRKIFLLLALSLILSSCKADNKNSDSTKEKNIEVEENETPKKKTDKKKTKEAENTDKSKDTSNKTSEKAKSEESPTEDKKNESEQASSKQSSSYKDGMYLSILSSDKSGEAQGEIGYCKSSYADSNKNIFTIEGSLSYNKDPKALEGYEIMANSTYEFPFDENTVFQATSGMAKPDIMTIDEFNKYLKECKDSGLGLVLVIENGHLKSVSISS